MPKMSKRILVIGIGAGNPDYITIQAVNALNEVDVFFITDKGENKAELKRLRQEICDRYIKDRNYRIVEFPPGKRDGLPESYRASIEAGNDGLEQTFDRLITEELATGECGAFLVWGDPSLYDSTLRILNHLQAKGGYDFDFEAIPGISSVQALAARHKVALNLIGESIEITTGRKLAEGFPNTVGSIVVMLDAGAAFKTLADQDLDIYWGAYVGTADEILVSGKLREVAGEIERLREAASARKGWIMDTYLLKKGN